MNSSYLFINNLRVHYLSWNQDGGGRPVVLLHDLGANARWWELAASDPVSEGLFSLAPDLRGHGLTDKPDGAYDFATFRRDLLAFVDAFPLERPLLAGHGWGALLALDYAASFPVGPRAPAGLFLVDGGLSQPDGGPLSSGEQAQELLDPPRLDGLSQEEYLSWLADQLRPRGLDERLAQILLADFEVGEDETLRPRLSRERRSQMEGAMRAFRISEQLARVRCPVQAALAVPPERVGRAPSERPVDNTNGLQRAREVLPELQIHRIPDTLFDIPLQRPVQLAQLIAGFAKQIP